MSKMGAKNEVAGNKAWRTRAWSAPFHDHFIEAAQPLADPTALLRSGCGPSPHGNAMQRPVAINAFPGPLPWTMADSGWLSA
jgi:hypothetical protein